jgi:HPt (histidine-containing phosphotransfer) domain-containing protein
MALSVPFPFHGAVAFAPASGEEKSRPAIDLVHLARQTMDDSALEIELLEMFDRQAERIAAEFAQTDRSDTKTLADLAHRLRGSALAMGANRIAAAAQKLEDCCAIRGPDADSLIRALTVALDEARAEIRRLTQ